MNKEIFLCVKCREKLKEAGNKVSLVRHCRDKKDERTFQYAHKKYRSAVADIVYHFSGFCNSLLYLVL